MINLTIQINFVFIHLELQIKQDTTLKTLKEVCNLADRDEMNMFLGAAESGQRKSVHDLAGDQATNGEQSPIIRSHRSKKHHNHHSRHNQRTGRYQTSSFGSITSGAH